jgi:hypothetical protein
MICFFEGNTNYLEIEIPIIAVVPISRIGHGKVSATNGAKIEAVLLKVLVTAKTVVVKLVGNNSTLANKDIPKVEVTPILIPSIII